MSALYSGYDFKCCGGLWWVRYYGHMILLFLRLFLLVSSNQTQPVFELITAGYGIRLLEDF
jgi:hypothetical protein